MHDTSVFDTTSAIAESFRYSVSKELNTKKRSEYGQYMTTSTVAEFMASLLSMKSDSPKVLDAGAGVGSLSAAVIDRLCREPNGPRELTITAFEIDPSLVSYLEQTFQHSDKLCRKHGIRLCWNIIQDDFVRAAVEGFSELGPFNVAIVNPPYRKIRTDSIHRDLLRKAGVETSNLYTGFLYLISTLLETNGELVAITPRSFCNGPYFRNFRRKFLDVMTFTHLHVFESRSQAFSEDHVLQENVIFRAIKQPSKDNWHAPLKVSANDGPHDDRITLTTVNYCEAIDPRNPERLIRIIKNDADRQISKKMARLSTSLDQLEIQVSTGRVVDFRSRDFLRDHPELGTVPLIYPMHLKMGRIRWPNLGGNKPNAIVDCQETADLLLPSGNYVLLKRFSAKEEKRRLVAALYDTCSTGSERFGIENHLNYFHVDRRGLPLTVAKGLTIFLNSSLADAYFRLFSGHTQVNATDLRLMQYPNQEQLELLGRLGRLDMTQSEIDGLIDDVCFSDKYEEVSV